jgi:hypothetical protein
MSGFLMALPTSPWFFVGLVGFAVIYALLMWWMMRWVFGPND